MESGQVVGDGFQLVIQLAEIHVPRMWVESHETRHDSEASTDYFKISRRTDCRFFFIWTTYTQHTQIASEWVPCHSKSQHILIRNRRTLYVIYHVHAIGFLQSWDMCSRFGIVCCHADFSHINNNNNNNNKNNKNKKNQLYLLRVNHVTVMNWWTNFFHNWRAPCKNNVSDLWSKLKFSLRFFEFQRRISLLITESVKLFLKRAFKFYNYNYSCENRKTVGTQ